MGLCKKSAKVSTILARCGIGWLYWVLDVYFLVLSEINTGTINLWCVKKFYIGKWPVRLIICLWDPLTFLVYFSSCWYIFVCRLSLCLVQWERIIFPCSAHWFFKIIFDLIIGKSHFGRKLMKTLINIPSDNHVLLMQLASSTIGDDKTIP